MILRLLTLITCLILATGAASANELFFETIPDVPLMEGLEELPGETVTFDQPEGRIMEALAATDGTSEDAITTFYNQTLPQLGWSQTGPGAFKRENEHLQLLFETHNQQNDLKVIITPG